MKLNVPEQTAPSRDDFPNHPRKVKKWLTELKQANMGDYTRRIYNGMLTLNRQSMTPKHRLENMETLREPCRHIFNQLHKHFVSRSLPLPEKSMKIIHLNQALLNEIAIGYKILIFESANDLVKYDAKIALLACERSLHYYSELLLRTSQIYASLAKGVWWDIHRIYAYAEQKGIHKKDMVEPELHGMEISVEDYYKQILLFSLARPNSLRQSDTERLYKSIGDWAKLTTLSGKPGKNELDRYFVSRLDGDLPPNCVSEDDLKNLQQIRSIDTSRLVERLQKTDTNQEDFSAAISIGDNVSQETLRTLIISWSLCAKRRFSRAVRTSDIVVAIGLNPIFEALNSEVIAPKSKTRNPGKIFSLESIPDNEMANKDIFAKQEDDSTFFITHPDLKSTSSHTAHAWDMVSKGRALTDTYTRELQAQEKNTGEINKEAPDLHWQLSNVSAGGYCLHWNSDRPSRALVGELVSIREQGVDNTYVWRVGVIRWMKYNYAEGLEIGVQVLSPKVISCTVSRPDRKNEEPFNCLMLPGIKPVQQPSTILLPAHAFRRDNTLQLQVYERDMKIKLGTIREHTGSFTQFQFTQLDGKGMPENDSSGGGEKSGNQDPDNFDSIWSSL
ncbi:DnaK-related protein [hydrothermal vent metagenome]|uniref:DnaK-related protein n=1 Tax=hydrothermal vent metagenome TaxID=652676 RepID=A0A3B0X8N9_9ZZZZ